MRKKLIDAIIKFTDDEILEDVKDLIELSKESDKQLVDRLISITQYYKDNV